MQILRVVPQIEVMRYFILSETGKEFATLPNFEEHAAQLEQEIKSLSEKAARASFVELSKKRRNELGSRLDFNTWYLVIFRSNELRLPFISHTVNSFLERVSYNLLAFASLVR